MKPHKHSELIKAWADGAEIQVKNNGEWINWILESSPYWNECEEYRIKPEPKPDVVRYGQVFMTSSVTWVRKNEFDNLKLTFDGETGELKSAEVLK